MGRKAVFGLDFDGCGEIVNWRIIYLDEIASLDLANNKKLAAINTAKYKACERVFIESIQLLAKNRDNPEVTCASNRQSGRIDKRMQPRFGGSGSNMSGLDTLSDFAQRQQFIFNPVLLVDAVLGKPAGSGFQDRTLGTPGLNIQGGPVKEWDPSKCFTLSHQFKLLSEVSPEQEIDFFFIDDDYKQTIFNGLKEYFIQNPDCLPANIHIHMIKFDYQHIFELELQLSEIDDMARQLMFPMMSISKNSAGCIVVDETPSFGSLLVLNPYEQLVQAKKDWLRTFTDSLNLEGFYQRSLKDFVFGIRKEVICNPNCKTLSDIQLKLELLQPANLTMPESFDIWFGELTLLALSEVPMGNLSSPTISV